MKTAGCVLLFALFLAGPAAGTAPAGEEPPAEGQPRPADEPNVDGLIAAGADFLVTIDPGERRWRTYVFEVPAGTTSVLVAAREATVDMDLYLRHGSQINDYRRDPQYRANGMGNDENILVNAQTSPPLKPGRYYLDVFNAGQGASAVRLTLRFDVGPGAATLPGPTGDRPQPVQEPNVDGLVADGMSFPIRISGQRNYLTYIIDVPADSRSLLVTVQGAVTDMDIYARFGAQMADYNADPDYRANSKANDEMLFIDGNSQPPLRPGRHYVDIARAGIGEVTASVSFRLNVDPPTDFNRTVAHVEARALTPGQPVDFRLDRAQRKYETFTIEVPPDAQSMHVWTFDATRDVDFYLKRGAPITNYRDDFEHRSISVRLNERMTIDRASKPPLRPGRYYLDVVSLIQKDVGTGGQLVVTFDEPPPVAANDFVLPPFPVVGELSVLERTILGTVEVSTERGKGSGNCLTAAGHILTNHHVIADQQGQVQMENIFISFTREFDEVPLQVFEARVLEYDAGLDLALLQVTADIYGRDLPDDLNLPHLPLGRAADLRIGDDLIILGYPSVGGAESRSSVSVTRGIVSGFTTRDGQRLWLKTDARINAGNSGGAAVNEAGELVGIPTRELIEADDELGYCRPVDLIPAAWQRRLAP